MASLSRFADRELLLLGHETDPSPGGMGVLGMGDLRAFPPNRARLPGARQPPLFLRPPTLAPDGGAGHSLRGHLRNHAAKAV